MLYSNMEITHVNDNRAPMMVYIKRAGIYLLILAILYAMFLL